MYNVRLKYFCSNVANYPFIDQPVCLNKGQPLGVAKGEEARVVCQVDSNPPPRSFK